MTTVKLSELPLASSISDVDYIPAIVNGQTVRTPVSGVKPQNVLKPSITAPTTGSTVSGTLTPTITLSAYRSLYGRAHGKTQVQVTALADTTFSSVSHDSGQVNATSSYGGFTGAELASYRARARYFDDAGNASDWTDAVTFTLPALPKARVIFPIASAASAPKRMKVNGDQLVSMSSLPSPSNTATAFDEISISDDGVAVGMTSAAVATGSANAMAYRYNSATDTYTQVALDVVASEQVRGPAMSPDGVYFHTGGSGNLINIYKWNGTSYVKMADPASKPTGVRYSGSWSTDGAVLMTGGFGTSPYGSRLWGYKRTGDTFAAFAAPDVVPANSVNAVSVCPAADLVAVAYGSAPWVTIYSFDRSALTITKVVDLTGPDGIGFRVAWDKTGTYLAVGLSGGTERVLLYKRTGTTFTKLAAPISVTAALVQGLAWTPDGHLVVQTSATPRVYLLKRTPNTDTFLNADASLTVSEAVKGVAATPEYW